MMSQKVILVNDSKARWTHNWLLSARNWTSDSFRKRASVSIFWWKIPLAKIHPLGQPRIPLSVFTNGEERRITPKATRTQEDKLSGGNAELQSWQWEVSREFTWVEAAEAGTHSNQCLCANLFTKLHRSLALASFWAFFWSHYCHGKTWWTSCSGGWNRSKSSRFLWAIKWVQVQPGQFAETLSLN